MISDPAPDILKVAVGLRCDVEEHRSSDTVAGDISNLGAVGKGELLVNSLV